MSKSEGAGIGMIAISLWIAIVWSSGEGIVGAFDDMAIFMMIVSVVMLLAGIYQLVVGKN